MHILSIHKILISDLVQRNEAFLAWLFSFVSSKAQVLSVATLCHPD